MKFNKGSVVLKNIKNDVEVEHKIIIPSGNIYSFFLLLNFIIEVIICIT